MPEVGKDTYRGPEEISVSLSLSPSGGGAEREALAMMKKSSVLAGRASIKVGLWEGAGHLSGRTS